MRTFILWLVLMVAVPTMSFATKIKDIDISPKNPKVGDTVKISVKTSGDVAKAEIEFTDLNIKKDLGVIGKNAWGISIPLNNPGEKKFKVLLYQKKKDKNPKDTEKDKFVVSSKNDSPKPKPVPAPVPEKQKPVPVVQKPQQQYGSVSGKVHKNSASGPALSGVSVNCGGKSATTDGNGNYKIDGITAGNQEISFSKSGYEGFKKTVAVKAGVNISDGDRWLTEISPVKQLPNVTSISVNPSSIAAGKSAIFSATTDSAASMVILRFIDAGIDVKMSGSGTTWKANPQINNAGNRPYTVIAYDKNNKAGRTKNGSIQVNKVKDTSNPTQSIVMPLDAQYKKINLDQCDIYKGYGTHRGVDIEAPDNKNVYAMSDGIVVENHKAYKNSNDYWNACLIVQHKVNSKIYYTYYAHITSDLNKNDIVKPGTKIGTVNLNHLHLSVNTSNVPYWGYKYKDTNESCDSVKKGGWLRFQDVFNLAGYTKK